MWRRFNQHLIFSTLDWKPASQKSGGPTGQSSREKLWQTVGMAGRRWLTDSFALDEMYRSDLALFKRQDRFWDILVRLWLGQTGGLSVY